MDDLTPAALAAMRREIAGEVLAELPRRAREAMRRQRCKQVAWEVAQKEGEDAD